MFHYIQGLHIQVIHTVYIDILIIENILQVTTSSTEKYQFN